MIRLVPNLRATLEICKNDEDGQNLIEYALLIALVALACVAGVQNVASAVLGVLSDIPSYLRLIPAPLS